jgi:hypothetical protein
MDEQPKRRRSEKDTVPKFKDGDDALAWMEKKLNGSWTDALDKDERESASMEFEVTEPLNLDNPNDVDTAFRKMMGL